MGRGVQGPDGAREIRRPPEEGRAQTRGSGGEFLDAGGAARSQGLRWELGGVSKGSQEARVDGEGRMGCTARRKSRNPDPWGLKAT